MRHDNLVFILFHIYNDNSNFNKQTNFNKSQDKVIGLLLEQTLPET